MLKTDKNTVEILEGALEFIEDEQRWTTAALFDNVDLIHDPLCNNVKACALGAIAWAAWNGMGVVANQAALTGDAYVVPVTDFRGKEDLWPLETNAVTESHDTKEAARLVDAISRHRGLSGIVTYNDASLLYPRDERYAEIKSIFREAIRVARNRATGLKDDIYR